MTKNEEAMMEDVELSEYDKSELMRYAKIAELKLLARKNRQAYRGAIKDFQKRMNEGEGDR